MASISDRVEEDREIVSRRFVEAPRGVVYRAFADPAILAQWWGPEGFTNTFHEFDLRPGGVWTFTMRGPDGAEFTMAKEVVDVAPLERIVFRHRQPMHNFEMTIGFEDDARGTRVTWRMLFDSAEEAALTRDAVTAGNEQNFDRLERQLQSMRSGAGGAAESDSDPEGHPD